MQTRDYEGVQRFTHSSILCTISACGGYYFTSTDGVMHRLESKSNKVQRRDQSMTNAATVQQALSACKARLARCCRLLKFTAAGGLSCIRMS